MLACAEATRTVLMVIFAPQLHTARKWFDSGEYQCSRQGVQLQDVLPGGAPVEVLPAKLEPSPTPGPRSRSHLQAGAVGLKQPGHTQQATTLVVVEY
jgi:hypothetical protein